MLRVRSTHNIASFLLHERTVDHVARLTRGSQTGRIHVRQPLVDTFFQEQTRPRVRLTALGEKNVPARRAGTHYPVVIISSGNLTTR